MKIVLSVTFSVLAFWYMAFAADTRVGRQDLAQVLQMSKQQNCSENPSCCQQSPSCFATCCDEDNYEQCGSMCSGGCCTKADWVCCPDNHYCAYTLEDCPSGTKEGIETFAKLVPRATRQDDCDPNPCATEPNANYCCPGGCCLHDWFCCPDNMYCADEPENCPSTSKAKFMSLL